MIFGVAEFRSAAGDSSRKFDVILSDMAPNTSGDRAGDHHRSARLCHALLDRCDALLKPGGNLVMKVFEGEAYPELLKRAKTMFDQARGYKPRASRSESAEMYIVALTFIRPGDERVLQSSSSMMKKPTRVRSSGWGRRLPHSGRADSADG